MFQRLPMCVLSLLLFSIGLLAGEEGSAPFEMVRYPRYEKGRLASEIIAQKAHTTAVGPKNTRVNMSGVTINLYDTSEKAFAATPLDQPLPLKICITSNKGAYERRQLSDLKEPEDIAYLQENVKVYRYKLSETGKPGDKKIIETEIRCENATWNNSSHIMTGSGLVTFNSWTHPDGLASGEKPDRILTGDDFTYEADDKFTGEAIPLDNMGGRFFLKKNVTMTIHERTAKSPTVITCKGLASFYLTARDLQFEDTVKVDRVGMVITSEFLRVWLLKGSDQPVKEIKAWKNVVIVSKAEADGKVCVAKGGSARYKCLKGELVLVDPRKGINPVADRGGDVVSNQVLEFLIKDGTIYQLKAVGDEGRAEMMTAGSGTSDKVLRKPVKTTITFKEYMIFQHSQNRAVFVGDIVLKRERLTLTADKLVADIASEKKPGEARQGIERLIADGNVVILRDDSKATAAKAEMDTLSEILVLRGTSDKTPPNPKVVKVGSIIEAPTIVILKANEPGADQQPRRIITGKGGPGTCVFTGTGEKAKTIIVRCVGEMTFDEIRNLVIFRNRVMASSEDPEDPYVLTSDTLEVTLVDEKVPATGKERKKISKIAAMDNANLIWGKRHCKADRIVRDVDRGIISLHSSGTTLATVYEEDGIEFQAPRIIATVAGDTIHANGPGVVFMPEDDEDKKSRAKITYAHRAIYTEINETTGRVLFEKDVVMERSGRGMTIYGDTMEANLEQRPKPEREPDKSGDGTVKIGRQLRRVTVRGNVRVKQKSANGRRNATGIKGILDKRLVGDIITLFGSQEKLADVYDNDGFRLISPKISILQGTGIITAIGPGEVHISSITTDLNKPLRKDVDKKVHTIVTYEEEMKYNELARKIKLKQNVRVRQENVKARSDVLEVRLMDDPLSSTTRNATDRLKAKSMDAEGRVRFWRFQAPRFKSQVDANPLDRPGKTIYTRSNKAFYDLIKKTVRLYGEPPRPQAIQQTLKYEESGAKRSRVVLTSGELLIDVDTGDVTGNPQPRIRYLKTAGPLEFDDE